MEILNIGPLELIVILLIMFFLLGPRGMIVTAQKIGQWIRKIVKSPVWQEIMGYSQDIRELPKKIMDDTGLKEALDEVSQTTKATAAELNATVNDAVQSARVPEAEHVTIDPTAVSQATTATTQLKSSSADSDTGTRKSYPVLPGAETKTTAPTVKKETNDVVPDDTSENAPVLDVEVDPEPIRADNEESQPVIQAENQSGEVSPEKKPRRRSRGSDSAESTPPSVDIEEKPIVQRKPRVKKAAQSEPASTAAETMPMPVETTSQSEAVQPALELDSAHVSGDSITPIAVPPQTRKPRAKRKTAQDAVVEDEPQEPASVQHTTLVTEDASAPEKIEEMQSKPRTRRSTRAKIKPGPDNGNQPSSTEIAAGEET